jgi:hypothetical protein
MIEAGKYIIIKQAFWTHSKATTLTVVESNIETRDIVYFYDNETNRRCRDFGDFEHIILVPHSPLLEELL